jgi:hypothetical protein
MAKEKICAEEKICSYCKHFWEPEGIPLGQGFCTYNPPRRVKDEPFAVFPRVRETCRCGRYQIFDDDDGAGDDGPDDGAPLPPVGSVPK